MGYKEDPLSSFLLGLPGVGDRKFLVRKPKYNTAIDQPIIDEALAELTPEQLELLGQVEDFQAFVNNSTGRIEVEFAYPLRGPAVLGQHVVLSCGVIEDQSGIQFVDEIGGMAINPNFVESAIQLYTNIKAGLQQAK